MPTTQIEAQLAPTVAQLPKISRSIPVQIPAGTLLNGQVTPSEIGVTAAGSRFYVRAASGLISMQALRAGNVGGENPFGVGQGQTVQGGFETLTVKNYNLFPVAALIWVGFEDFINDQLVLASNQTPIVCYPTQSLAGVATTIAIADISGLAFNDINGKKWLAISRAYFIVTNLDPVTPLNVQKAGSAVQNGASIDCVQPLQSHRIDTTGSFQICIGGGAINGYVSEFYYAIAA